jgi:GNAT superfamily N-acetyltransferase
MRSEHVTASTQVNGFTARAARPEDLEGARALMHRTFFEDFGYPELTPFHDDTLDLQAAYLAPEESALFVAVDDATGDVIATCAAHPWNRRHPEHPDWLHERYQAKRGVELLRCYTAAEHRRRGAQRELIELARRWVLLDGRYEVIVLHTNAGIPGAEPFWRSVAYEMHDSRPCRLNTVHFELPTAWAVRGARGPVAP